MKKGVLLWIILILICTSLNSIAIDEHGHEGGDLIGGEGNTPIDGPDDPGGADDDDPSDETDDSGDDYPGGGISVYDYHKEICEFPDIDEGALKNDNSDSFPETRVRAYSWDLPEMIGSLVRREYIRIDTGDGVPTSMGRRFYYASSQYVKFTDYPSNKLCPWTCDESKGFIVNDVNNPTDCINICPEDTDGDGLVPGDSNGNPISINGNYPCGDECDPNEDVLNDPKVCWSFPLQKLKCRHIISISQGVPIDYTDYETKASFSPACNLAGDTILEVINTDSYVDVERTMDNYNNKIVGKMVDGSEIKLKNAIDCSDSKYLVCAECSGGAVEGCEKKEVECVDKDGDGYAKESEWGGCNKCGWNKNEPCKGGDDCDDYDPNIYPGAGGDYDCSCYVECYEGGIDLGCIDSAHPNEEFLDYCLDDVTRVAFVCQDDLCTPTYEPCEGDNLCFDSSVEGYRFIAEAGRNFAECGRCDEELSEFVDYNGQWGYECSITNPQDYVKVKCDAWGDRFVFGSDSCPPGTYCYVGGETNSDGTILECVNPFDTFNEKCYEGGIDLGCIDSAHPNEEFLDYCLDDVTRVAFVCQDDLCTPTYEPCEGDNLCFDSSVEGYRFIAEAGRNFAECGRCDEELSEFVDYNGQWGYECSITNPQDYVKVKCDAWGDRFVFGSDSCPPGTYCYVGGETNSDGTILECVNPFDTFNEKCYEGGIDLGCIDEGDCYDSCPMDLSEKGFLNCNYKCIENECVAVAKKTSTFTYPQSTLNIKPGYNMFSTNTGTTIEDLWDDCGVIQAWEYTNNNWNEITTFESGKGYYIYAVAECDYTIPEMTAEVETYPGWNLIYLPTGNVKELLPNSVIAWNWDGNTYKQAKDLSKPTTIFTYLT